MAGPLARSFKLNLFILRLLGLYPTDTHKYLYKLRAYITFFVSLFPASTLCFLQLFLEGNVAKVNSNDIASIGIIFLTVKFFNFLINCDDLKECVLNFDKIFSETLRQKQQEIIEECVKICVRNSRIFFICVSLTLSGWLSTLFFQDARINLPLNVWLPFEYDGHPYLYFVLYSSLLGGVIYSGMACASIDPLIPGIICHAAGQIRVLKDTLQNVDRDLSGRKNDLMGGTIYNRIIKCVIHYKDIVHFVSRYEKCCSAVVFTQFMESIFVIGLCCLQITKEEGVTVNFLIMVNYLFTFLFQVYFYCYYGTTLLEENTTVTTAIYMSQWYNYNQDSKKALVILMERAKRPLFVSAGKVLDLSLDTFTLILNRAYSLVAVFKSYY